MVTWIIPQILPASLIRKLPEEILTVFAELTVGLSIYHIEKFIANYENATDANDREVALKLKRSCTKVFDRRNFYKDSEIIRMVSDLKSLSYENVTMNEDVHKLKKWRDNLTYILGNEFYDAYEPYVGHDEMEAIFEKMEGMCKPGEPYVEYAGDVQELIGYINANRGFWRSAPGRKPKATVFAGIVFDQMRFELILYGLNFIIEKIEKNESPIKWRVI